eukprot:2235599-Rhodomonas_salina.2
MQIVNPGSDHTLGVENTFFRGKGREQKSTPTARLRLVRARTRVFPVTGASGSSWHTGYTVYRLISIPEYLPGYWSLHEYNCTHPLAPMARTGTLEHNIETGLCIPGAG